MSEGDHRVVVHMVGNAHIDPVWLWNWQAGVDEALATFRSAADRCDEYPEFIYTRGESWLYAQVEELDPPLFARVRKLVEKGQWHISGGQFLQPDVNAPTEMGLRRQIEHGRRWFRDRFGVEPDIGYNLDSFGHPATLPDILRDMGYRAYVFHRPKPVQVELPGPAFRWRGSGGGEVLAFRIIPGYTTLGEDLTGHVRQAVEHADPRVGHAMCFYGVGNHGGGPTKADIEFILDHRLAFDGVELLFSTPQAFFDAIEPKRDVLPLVTKELQRTFPGCYSVMHDVKQAQRHGEHLLQHASDAVASFSADAAALDRKLDAAWEDLLFTAFHDILAGTSIPSAWGSVRAMQGRARIAAEEVLVSTTRTWARENLPDVNHQQLIVMNSSGRDRTEYVEVEPWLDMDPWGDRWLSDMQGDPVAYQVLQPEAPQITSRLLVPVDVPMRSALHLLVRDDPPSSPRATPNGDLQVDPSGISNGSLDVRMGSEGVERVRYRGADLLGQGGIGLHLRQDSTDTWTFHTDRFTEPVTERFRGGGWSVEEEGPLRARLRTEGRLGTSRVLWTVDLYRHEPRLRMRLEVNFDERHTLLQMPIALTGSPTRWLSALAGGEVERELGEIEWPVQGWSRVDVQPAGGEPVELALLTQDAYSLRCGGDTWQWTLLRSPRMAWGGGNPRVYGGRNHYTDQGVHAFDLELRVGIDLRPDALHAAADDLVRPPIAFDRYQGMNRPLGRRASSEPVQALFQRSGDEA